MNRVSEAIRANGRELKAASEAVGDEGLPDVSDMNKSVSHWLTLLIAALGLALISYGFFYLEATLCANCSWIREIGFCSKIESTQKTDDRTCLLALRTT